MFADHLTNAFESFRYEPLQHYLHCHSHHNWFPTSVGMTEPTGSVLLAEPLARSGRGFCPRVFQSHLLVGYYSLTLPLPLLHQPLLLLGQRRRKRHLHLDILVADHATHF
jgi:hypothetical protein